MRKNRYRCKRYLLYLPVAIGDAIDTSLDYTAKLFGPFLIILPKGAENLLSRVEKLEKPDPQNTLKPSPEHTSSMLEGSRTPKDEN